MMTGTGGGTDFVRSHGVEVLPYDPNYFFDRKDEIDRVTSIVNAIIENKMIERRTLLFTGERGVGKTWLLLHLHKTKLKEKKTSSLYIDLENKKIIDNNSEIDYEYDLLSFLKQLAKIWGARTADDATLQEQSYWLEQ
ncbi:MAG: AAA family ATPase, partial [Anaerolineae bacterium]|nr:AAA family ATPase [Anaerolineae bacterium]